MSEYQSLLLLPDKEFCVITAQCDNNIWHFERPIKVMFHTGSGMKDNNFHMNHEVQKNAFPFLHFPHENQPRVLGGNNTKLENVLISSQSFH